MVGAMLCGDEPLHGPVFTWLRRFGGNLFTQLPIMVSARSCLRRHTTFAARFTKMRGVVRRVREALAALGDRAGGSDILFEPAEPQACLVHTYFGAATMDTVMDAIEEVQRDTGVRVVSRVRQSRFAPEGVVAMAADGDCPPAGVLQPFTYTEWNMGVCNMEIDDDTFVQGWTALAKALAARRQPQA